MLDGFHTYRGRQGADVAMFVRRFGTAAAQTRTAYLRRDLGDDGERRRRCASGCAAVATSPRDSSGLTIRPDAVIDESFSGLPVAGPEL